MARCLFLGGILLLFTFFSFAQVADSTALSDSTAQKPVPKLWKLGGGFNLNFNQVSLNNWTGGGNSSIALGGLTNLYAEYKNGGSAWVNRVSFAYGVLRQGERGEQVQKTDDQIILISRYSQELVENWSLSGNLDFRTQFDDGYKYTADGPILISQFMSPGYLLANIGATYKYKDIFSATISPLASRTTFVLNERGGRINPMNYGLDTLENVRFQGGLTVILSLRKELMENINVLANVNLFSDYEAMWPFDMTGELVFNMKVNKFITASLSTQFVYDSQIIIEREDGTNIEGPFQLKNIIAIGFAYNFKNHKD